MEKKKRTSGTKVSVIANIFQSKPLEDSSIHQLNSASLDRSFKLSAQSEDLSLQSTVSGTESHVTRFNNARAMFEKLGGENRTNQSHERLVKSADTFELRSRSTSANCSFRCLSPLHSPQPPLSRFEDHSDKWSTNTPVPDSKDELENNHLSFSNESVELRNQSTADIDQNYFQKRSSDGYLDMEKKSRKEYSSKKLIEKQKNWTSHFLEARMNKTYSDPNKWLIQSSLNEIINKINIVDDVSSSPRSYSFFSEQSKFYKKLVDPINVTFQKSCSYTYPSTCVLPPPLSIRKSSSRNEKKSEFMVNAEYATIKKFNISVMTDKRIQIVEQHDIGNKDEKVPEDAIIHSEVSSVQSCRSIRFFEKNLPSISSCETIPQLTQFISNGNSRINKNDTMSDSLHFLVPTISPISRIQNTRLIETSSNNEEVKTNGVFEKLHNESINYSHENQELREGVSTHSGKITSNDLTKFSSVSTISSETVLPSSHVHTDLIRTNSVKKSTITISNRKNSSNPEKDFILETQTQPRKKLDENIRGVLENKLFPKNNLTSVTLLQEDELNMDVFEGIESSSKYMNSNTTFQKKLGTRVLLNYTKKSNKNKSILQTSNDMKGKKELERKHNSRSINLLNNDVLDLKLNQLPTASDKKELRNREPDDISHHEEAASEMQSSLETDVNKRNIISEVELGTTLSETPSSEDQSNNHHYPSKSVSDDTLFHPSENNRNEESANYSADLTTDSSTRYPIGSVTDSEIGMSATIIGSYESTNAKQSNLLGECLPIPARIVLVENGIHYFEDGNFWVEVTGNPEVKDNDMNLDNSSIMEKIPAVTFNLGAIRIYSTHSVNEYDRRNEDVDPVAASAEYELEKRVERMEVFPVELVKGPDGLGLSIIGMGVGADAGLEKLGIFVKTITKDGSAARDGRIQVNDQIVEVDGKSLVGVTQAYAASVLRNTCGLVRFLIGREKDSKNSEVAILIRQSLSTDKERRITTSNRYLNSSEPSNGKQGEKQGNFDDENGADSSSGIFGKSNLPTSPTLPSYLGGEDPDSSFGHHAPIPSTRSSLFSSSSSTDPIREESGSDFDKAKIIPDESAILERNDEIITDNHTVRHCKSDLRSYQPEEHSDVTEEDFSSVKDILSYGTARNIVLLQKYAQAKKVMRELRADIISRDKFYQQLLQEKDLEYKAHVKSLRDKIITLEVELTEMEERFGLPVRLPYDGATRKTRAPYEPQQHSPRSLSFFCLYADSEGSDIGSPDDGCRIATVECKQPLSIPIEEKLIPIRYLPDNLTGECKAKLSNRGGLENQQLPKRSGGLSSNSSDIGVDGTKKKDDSSIFEAEVFATDSPIFSNAKRLSMNSSQNTSLARLQTEVRSRTSDLAASKQRSTISLQIRALTEQSLKISQEIEEEDAASNDPKERNTLCSTGDYLSNFFSVNSINSAVTTLNLSKARSIEKSYPSSDDNWIPPTVIDSGFKDKLSCCWKETPILSWSENEVHQWLADIGLENYASQISKAGIDGNSLLRLESRDLKNYGIFGNGKTHFKKKLKELRAQSDREKKERKIGERVRSKVEKITKK